MNSAQYMNLMTNLKVSANAGFAFEQTNVLPSDPMMGQMALVDGVLYIYVTISGVTTWFPLTNGKSAYVHTQSVAATAWSVTHGLDSKNFVYMCYDANHNLTIANVSDVTLAGFTANFSVAQTGTCVVFVESEVYLPTVGANNVATQTLTVDGGTTVIDSLGVVVNGVNISTTAVDNAAAITVLNAGSGTAGSVDAKIATVVGAAPAALDTLVEIGASLANDADFAGTMTTQLSLKATVVDLTAEETARTADTTNLQAQISTKLNSTDYNAADVLAKLITTDGPGSALDADTLDGKELATIESDRQSADATLQSNITAEAGTARAAETANANDIASEITRATAAEATLQGNVDSVVPNLNHGGVISCVDAQATYNANFKESFAMVYLNRMLLRPTEWSASCAAGSCTSITVDSSISITDGDELEIVSIV